MSLGPIQNGKDKTLSQVTGTLPNMSDALLSYFQPMVFTVIVDTISSNFEVVETPTNVTFYGVWQPWQPQDLDIKNIGERDWSWFQLHSDTTLELKPDDVVTYQDVQYRVREKLDYSSYSYYEYHLQRDYTGAGPNS